MRYLHVQDKKMRIRSILFIGATVAMLLLPSCKKKDEDSEVSPSLSGSLSYSIPAFVLPGESFTLVPKGVTNPTTGNVGYAWASSWTSGKDTVKTETGIGDGSWTVTLPEEIGQYTVTGYAFAADYSSLATTKTVCVVDPTVDVTITGAGYQTDSVTFKDPRDGGVYYLATTGGQTWMQNNLHYSGSGVSYEYCSAMDPLFGRLYTWDEALNACPDGWHLPSDAEFAKLASSAVEGVSFSAGDTFTGAAGALMANALFIGSKMWAFWPQVPITNATKFSAIPVGYAVDQEISQKYMGTNSYAVFWTTDDKGSEGLYRYIYVDKNDIFGSTGDKKSFRASVRCLKD